MPNPDFSSFPLVSKEHGYEDFEEGQIFEHHWVKESKADE